VSIDESPSHFAQNNLTEELQIQYTHKFLQLSLN